MADLKITVTDGKKAVVAGAKDTYTVTVTNSGPDSVAGAQISDQFPSSFAGVSYTGSGTGGASGFTSSGSGNINDTVTMPSGSTITYNAAGTLSSGATGTLANTANVAVPAGVTDPNLGDNSATDSDRVNLRSDLKVTVTDGKTTAVAGTRNTYTITVTNVGPSNVSGASLTDTFPATFINVTYTATQSGGASGFNASGSGNISDTALTLPAKAKVTYKAKGTISSSATGSISNTATAAVPAGVTDPNTASNSATDTDTL